jgi:hypothetical protein
MGTKEPESSNLNLNLIGLVAPQGEKSKERRLLVHRPWTSPRGQGGPSDVQMPSEKAAGIISEEVAPFIPDPQTSLISRPKSHFHLFV